MPTPRPIIVATVGATSGTEKTWPMSEIRLRPVMTPTMATPPYRYTWADRSDGATYTLYATITDTTGCLENLTRYITDQAPAACAVDLFSSTVGSTTVDSPSAASLTRSARSSAVSVPR